MVHIEDFGSILTLQIKQNDGNVVVALPVKVSVAKSHHNAHRPRRFYVSRCEQRSLRGLWIMCKCLSYKQSM